MLDFAGGPVGGEVAHDVGMNRHARHGRPKMEPDVGEAFPRLAAIQFAQRHRRNAHLVRLRPRQKPQPEHLKSMRGGHAVELFVHGADQHLTPETFDRARGLPLLAQPIEHGDSIQIRATAFARDGQQRAAYRKLFPGVQKRELEKRFREMRGGGEHPRFQDAPPASRLDEGEFPVKGDIFFDVQPPVEIQEVDATAQQDVLAVVDQFGLAARSDFVGGCTAAGERPRFEDLYGMPRAAQGRGRGESGETTPDDDHFRHAKTGPAKPSLLVSMVFDRSASRRMAGPSSFVERS